MSTELILHNNISEADFLARFPDPYCVKALIPWEAHRAGLNHKIQQWRFTSNFRYYSDRFGWITIPAGTVTDFASIPRFARSIIDDDSPTILFGSAPHDRLFAVPFTDSGRELTLREVNQVLLEAMWYCGAGRAERAAVFAAVQSGGAVIWNNR